MQSPDRACIVIDSSPLRYLLTGLGQFSYHLLEELSKRPFEDARLLALVHPRYSNLVPQGISIVTASWLRRHAPPVLQSLLMPRCRVWHMTTENTRLTGIPRTAKLVLTIHGLHFLDEKSPDEAAKELKKVQELVDRASIICVVSNFTRNLVKQKLNTGAREIDVIPNGISYPDEPASKPTWATGSKKFLFTVGTFFTRKNFQVLIPMMTHLPEFDLIMAGDCRTDFGNEIKSKIQAAGLQSRIILAGEVTDGEKRWLYENGEALLFPSISEGFGIPVIEAFHAGTPVFCSLFGSLPEVGASHAWYWDQLDPEPMAKIVREKLLVENASNRDARKNYSKSFSWSSTAEKYLEVYSRLL